MAFEREWRDLAYLPRWSIVRTLRQQSVAEHSYYVCVYARQIADIVRFDGDYAELLKYAMAHDLEELETGDLAAPAKKQGHVVVLSEVAETIVENLFGLEVLGDMFKTSRGVKAIVKAADCMDAVMFLCEELQMGNKTLGEFNMTLPFDPQSILLSQAGYGGSHNSVFTRNLFALARAWGNMQHTGLACSDESLLESWNYIVLPSIQKALTGISKRTF